ncbi:MAG: hypothetical protein EPN85_08580 [Bacteroidetes bacterium]|nr:MAG: hypothetical protein EPN85_08580 [Bacteroidota bacterium]
MKTLFCFSIISLLFSSYSIGQKPTQKQKTDLEVMNLKGKVKSIQENKYAFVKKFGKVKKRKILIDYLYLLNETGNLIEEKGNWYSPDGRIAGKYNCKYDGKGNIIEENKYFEVDCVMTDIITVKQHYGNWEMLNYNTCAGMDSKSIHKYDNHGKLIESNCYNSVGSLTEKETFSYNNNGNVIENNSYRPNGILTQKSIYQYDSTGNMIESNFYNLDGSHHVMKYICEYDDKGNQIEKNIYYDSLRTEKTIYKYDGKGNQIEIVNTTYGDNGIFRNKNTCKYKYNDQGDKIEENKYEWNGNLINKRIFHYNVNRDLIEYNYYHYDIDGSVAGLVKYTYKYDSNRNIIYQSDLYDSKGRMPDENTCSYEYDEKNNWIKRTEFRNNDGVIRTESDKFKVNAISERVIEYF